MSNALVIGRREWFSYVKDTVGGVRPGGVDYDASKSDEWQIAYMFMVARACGAFAMDVGYKEVCSDGSFGVGVDDRDARCVGDGVGERVCGDTCVSSDGSVFGDATPAGACANGQEVFGDFGGVNGVAGGRVGGFSGGGAVKKNKPGKKMRDRLARKATTRAMDGDWRERKNKSDAQKTLEEKWVLENQLAKVRLQKDLEVQQRRDINAEVRCNQVKVLKKTEQDKVAVEKAYSTLKATGNVEGFCETLVSGANSTETISPHSSVSEKDVWELNKRVEDLELENAQLKRQYKLGRVELGETVAFTLDEHGAVPESLMDKFEGFNDRDHELLVDIDGGLFDKREKFRSNTVVLKKKVIPCAGDFDW